jgi:hypothetical protein
MSENEDPETKSRIQISEQLQVDYLLVDESVESFEAFFLGQRFDEFGSEFLSGKLDNLHLFAVVDEVFVHQDY